MKRYKLLILAFFGSVCGIANAQDNIKWENLFDGKTLNGWEQVQGSARYEARDRMIIGTTTLNSPNSFLATKKNYGNFILELDFKVDAGLNSGIQFRSQKDKNYKDGIVHGYQVEIDPSERSWTGGIYDEKRRGWLADLSRTKRQEKLLNRANGTISGLKLLPTGCIPGSMGYWPHP